MCFHVWNGWNRSFLKCTVSYPSLGCSCGEKLPVLNTRRIEMHSKQFKFMKLKSTFNKVVQDKVQPFVVIDVKWSEKFLLSQSSSLENYSQSSRNKSEIKQKATKNEERSLLLWNIFILKTCLLHYAFLSGQKVNIKYLFLWRHHAPWYHFL